MSEFSENKEIKTDAAEESTIFSAPLEHNDVIKNTKKNKLIGTIAAVVAAAILAVSSFAVVKLVPDKQSESDSPLFEEIKVLDIDSANLSTVTVTNPNGTFEFKADTTTVTNENGTVSQAVAWNLEGQDMSKLNKSEIDDIINAACSITSHRRVTEKTDEECGIDKPRYTVTVTSPIMSDYTIWVGDASPDAMGVYLKVSTNKDIFLVTTGAAEAYNFNVLDLALVNSFGAASFSSGTADYFDESGSLISFDKITVSGKKMTDTLEIVPNDDEKLSSLAGYMISKPIDRYAAESTSDLVNLFSGMTAVDAVYALDVNDKTLKEFGLDDPDLIISMTIRGETKTYKISEVDSQYCAMINQDSTVISKVARSNLKLFDYKIEDYYSTWITKNMLVDLSRMTFTLGETEHIFDIAYDKEAENSELEVTYNGKKVKETDFQKYYELFVGIACSDFTVGEVSDKADLTVKMDFAAGGSQTVSFYKSGDVKYQYSIDSVPLGKITSSAYNRMIKGLETLINGIK